MMRELACQ